MGLSEQVLLNHCSAKNFLTIWHVLSITTLCIRILRAEEGLSIFKLPCNLFWMLPIVDSTSGIMWAILWSFPVMVL